MRTGEDRRVIKTKRNLKNTMREMMGEMPFEKITVKEICERAMTSRITFYNYYNDKYALLEEMIHDMKGELEAQFQKLQEANTEDDPIVSFENMLDCLIHLHEEYKDIFVNNVNIGKNSALIPPYYRFMVNNIEKLIRKYFQQMKPNYPPEQISVFIFLGLFGYIYLGGGTPGESDEETYKSAHRLLSDLLKSDIFTNRK
ncbi:MAG: TetR/AcrR family transcriptional regulator [Bilifractor sp.]